MSEHYHDESDLKLMREMRMAPAMSRTLRETQMRMLIRIIHALGRVALNRLREPARKIGTGQLFRNLRLGLFHRMNN